MHVLPGSVRVRRPNHRKGWGLAELAEIRAGSGRDQGRLGVSSSMRGLLGRVGPRRRSRASRRTAPRRGSRPGAARTTGSTSATVTSRPSSRLSEVTPASAMLHGTNRSNQPRSTSQLSEKPCIVTPRLTRMPSAAILRSGRLPVAGSSARSQTPLRPGHAGGGDAEVGADPDQRLLDPAYVVDDHDVVGQRDDRVADQLAGAVEGDRAAAVDVDDRRAGRVGGTVVRLGALAGGEDRRVLEQQRRVGLVAVGDALVHLALEVPRGEVVERCRRARTSRRRAYAEPVEERPRRVSGRVGADSCARSSWLCSWPWS